MRKIKADSSPSCRRMESSRLALDKTVVDYILGREEQYKMTERQERMIENERNEAAREATIRNAKKLLQNGADINLVSKSLDLSDADLAQISKRLR